eukprot:607692-Heterocapsa_arctica.AAC.1
MASRLAIEASDVYGDLHSRLFPCSAVCVKRVCLSRRPSQPCWGSRYHSTPGKTIPNAQPP